MQLQLSEDLLALGLVCFLDLVRKKEGAHVKVVEVSLGSKFPAGRGSPSLLVPNPPKALLA